MRASKGKAAQRVVEIAVYGALAAIFLAGIAYLSWGQIARAYEAVDLELYPEASKAFGYGMKYFEATGAQYDIGRAEQFFRTARRIDPKYPAVNHQLARIAFLRGDYLNARLYINQELRMYAKENPNAYYVRALIYGYQGDYKRAAADYEEYFKVEKANWAAINDYAWVLLKADLPEGAYEALSWGLKEWPQNAWLLNNQATALYELGRYGEAHDVAERASVEIDKLTRADWLNAYPGNDPEAADHGLDSFKRAAKENLQKIRQAAN